MSTTRLVFIIVCVVLAAILIFFGIVFQRNSRDRQISLQSVLASVGKKRRRGIRLPKDSRIWMTVALALCAVVLVFVMSKR